MSGLFFLKLLCVFFICGYASGADRYAFVGETVIVRLKGCEWPIQWYVNGFEWNEWVSKFQRASCRSFNQFHFDLGKIERIWQYGEQFGQLCG